MKKLGLVLAPLLLLSIVYRLNEVGASGASGTVGAGATTLE